MLLFDAIHRVPRSLGHAYFAGNLRLPDVLDYHGLDRKGCRSYHFAGNDCRSLRSSGSHLYSQARVYADRVDDCLYLGVRFPRPLLFRRISDPALVYSYPIFNFALPVYSFWRMDSYSWGQTRTIEGDGNHKKMLVEADDYFEDSMIPLERFQGESIPSPRFRFG